MDENYLKESANLIDFKFLYVHFRNLGNDKDKNEHK